MSLKKSAKATAKPVAKPAALKSKAKPAGKSAKGSKGDEELDLAAELVSRERAMEEAEEREEQEDAAAARSSSGSGAAEAALQAAAGGGTQEASASFKNFRHHPDMENFYRFIHDNDLRYEAKTIIGQILVEKQALKAARQAKTIAH